MKRLNPKTGKPFKYGDVREDGMIFQSYSKKHYSKTTGYIKEYWKSALSVEMKRWDNAIREKEKYANDLEYRQNKLQYIKTWSQSNPGKRKAKTAKRRAAEMQRTPKWLSKEQLRLIEDIYAKSIELAKSTGIEHQVDHIVPLQGKTVSGLHVPWNLQILTAKENRNKSNSFDNLTIPS